MSKQIMQKQKSKRVQIAFLPYPVQIGSPAKPSPRFHHMQPSVASLPYPKRQWFTYGNLYLISQCWLVPINEDPYQQGAKQ